MPTPIIFNGKTYANFDEMPPKERQAYQQLMAILIDQDQNGVPDIMDDGLIKGMGKLLADENKDGVPDVFENAQSNTPMHTTTFVVDGKTYRSPDEMPAEARQRYEAAMRKMNAGSANVPEWLAGMATPAQTSPKPGQSSELPEWLNSLGTQPAASPNSVIEPENTDWRLPLAGCVIFLLLIAVGMMAFLLMAR
jgi:hypothetical protein